MECLISQENLQTLVNEYNYIVKFASTLSHFQFKHKSQNILCIELWTSSWGSYGSRISVIGITFRLVQSLSHICFFETPWNEACQPSLSFTISRSLLNLMSIELVIPSNHLILCPPRLLLLPSAFLNMRVFSSKLALHIKSPKSSVFPMNSQGWFPLGLTYLISLRGRDSQESSPAGQFESINSSAQPSFLSNSYIRRWLLEKL